MTASASVRRAAAERQGIFTRVWRWVKKTICASRYWNLIVKKAGEQALTVTLA